MQPICQNLFRWAVTALVAVAVLVASAAAGPFSQFVVFGDSLSDVGNLQAAISSYPGPYYYNGRFSNGPVYAEALSLGLGLGPTVRSTASGSNFAYGGAQTSGTGFPYNLFVKDVDDQVDLFLASRTADPNALFLVFAGSNDLIGGQTNVNLPVNNLADDIQRLIADGARQFLVANLPLLGYTPRFNASPTTLAQYNTRTSNFNAALDGMLDSLEAGNSALTIFRLDVAGLFNQALANPAAFGLTNVTQSAAPGLQPGANSYNTNQIAPNANQYMFWDDLHPTATVHAALAQAALDLLLPLPGDFNDDETVDAADYVVWRDGLGTDFTQADYDTWRAHFGQTSGNNLGATAGLPSSVFSAVPEPASLALVAMAAALLIARRDRT